MGKDMAPAITMLATVGPALAIGILSYAGLISIGRNPEAAGAIQRVMILAIVFCEAIAIYALMVALLQLLVA